MKTPKNTEPIYRYPGVTPFAEAHSGVFFGRKEETDKLYRLVGREQVVVLHSKSGLGKSSIINAGLVPSGKEKGEFTPLVIRFGPYVKKDNPSLTEITKEKINALNFPRSFISELLPDDHSLWLSSKNHQMSCLEEKTSGNLLLIFDQFEELFTYPKNEYEGFFQELLELLNGTAPLRFRRMIERSDTLTEEEEDFFDTPLEVHVLFSIRSDKKHLLDRLKMFLPNIQRFTFELQALSEEDAKDAILLPASLEGNFYTPPFEYSPEVLDSLLQFLQNEENGRVEGILLQMLCEYYERQIVKEKKLSLLESQQVGNPEEIIKRYYMEKIESLAITDQLPSRILIEEGLISDGETMRIPLHESYIIQEYGVDKPLLETLINKRLLRSEPFIRGGYNYEISHDRLVNPILSARNERRFQKAKEEAERIKKEQQEKLEQARLRFEKEKELREKAEEGEQLARQMKEKAEKEEQLARQMKEKAEDREQLARRRTRLASGALIIAFLLLLTAGYFLIRSRIAENNYKTTLIEVTNTRDEIEDKKNELSQSYYNNLALQFKLLEIRANTILDAGGCPLDIFERMRAILSENEDQVIQKNKAELEERFKVLYSRNPDCQ